MLNADGASIISTYCSYSPFCLAEDSPFLLVHMTKHVKAILLIDYMTIAYYINTTELRLKYTIQKHKHSYLLKIKFLPPFFRSTRI